MGACGVCPPGDNQVPDHELVDHLRVVHPDVFEEPQRWPDGGFVFETVGYTDLATAFDVKPGGQT